MNNTLIPILSIVGRSKSGKTTLLEKLIPELKLRNYRIATIKHHAHQGFDIDQPGKDTWRHAQAGSDHVIIAAPDKLASIRQLARELSLDEIVREINNVDLILTEGFRQAGKPAVEVVRRETGLELLCRPNQLIAIVTDVVLPSTVPQFTWVQIRELSDLIEKRFLAGEPPQPG